MPGREEDSIGWETFAHALPVGKDTLSAMRMRVMCARHSRSDSNRSRTLLPAANSLLTPELDPSALRRFGKWDGNGNKALSLAEVSESMQLAMGELPQALHKRAAETWALAWNSHVRPLMRFFVRERDAFRAANGQRLPKRKHDYVERDEFRILLLCLRQYVCLHAALQQHMSGRRLDAPGFQAALPVFERWGLRLQGGDPEVAEVAAELSATRDGMEPLLRWAVEEGHLQIVDECAAHAVTELDGEHFSWVFN